MFIYEIENIVVDGKVVNGLVFKSSIDATGETEKTLVPAAAGDKVGLIYAYLEDEEPTIKFNAEYTVEFNEDETKVADDVKIFAYQGEADLNGKMVKGCFFKPVPTIFDCGSLKNGENVVVLAEEEDGQRLETATLSVEKATIINCTPYYGDVEFRDHPEIEARPGSDFQSDLQFGEPSDRGTVATGTLKYTSWPEAFPEEFHWFAVVKLDPAEGTLVNYSPIDTDGIYILGFTADGGRRMVVTTDDGYEKFYTFEHCTFEPAPEEEPEVQEG